ncbi:MAG: OprO/OprP family phosphate-selective porin [Candidatus Brocadiaceae bacterium]|nr:OprO/OprP family phosphate-selective porin [Candidatus Brocadiaceae bacterium]
MIFNFLIFCTAIAFSFVCYGNDAFNTSEIEIPDGMSFLPEDYYFNSEAIFTEEDNWKKFEFHGFLEFTTPIKGKDDDSQQPSSRFEDQNELILWMRKHISQELSFNSEIEIKEGFQKYELEILQLDYEIIPELLVFRLGKFKYPFGIERFVEDGPYDKLVDRPFPSIRIIPGTYSDIGGMLYGLIPLKNKTPFKYEFAVTNGLEGPEPQHVQQFTDNNSNKAIGGRISYECFSGFEFGGSFSRGAYDNDNQLDLIFWGTDLQFTRGNFELRGEYITGIVEQTSKDGGDYHRNGYYLQTSYKYPCNVNHCRYLEGVFRFDSVDPNRDITDGEEADRVAIGINYSPMEHVEFKFEYAVENEPGEDIHGKSFFQTIFRW